MIGGFERYYQIVRCFRDEDARADRLPEFTQLDIEMAFVDEEDVLETSEAAIGAVFAQAGFDVPAPPWPRMTHAEAMEPLRLRPSRHPLRPGARRPRRRVSEQRVQGVLRARWHPAASCAASTPGARELTRSDLDALTELAKQHGAKGLVWAFVQDERADGRGARRSPSSSRPTEIDAITEALSAQPGDVLFIVADEPATANQVLGALRLEMARRFDLVPEGVHDIRWVVQFPMFTFKPEEQRWDAEHHPFTAPATAAGAPATVADMDDPGDAAVALL